MYIFRITRTRLDLLAQPPHMNIYGADIAARRRPVAPDKAQQLLAAVNLAAVGNQELKQIKLLGRQPNGLAAEHHGAVLAVDLQIVHRMTRFSSCTSACGWLRRKMDLIRALTSRMLNGLVM